MLFHPPPVQYAIEETSYQPFFPVSGLNSIVEISVVNLGKSYLDLYGSYIAMTACIRRDDGEVPSEKEIVFPANHLFSAMFKSVNVYANQKLVSSNELYNIRSILDIMLHSSESSKKTHHAAGLYFEDEPNKQDDVSANGPKQRFEITKGGKDFNMVGRLNVDLFQQNRLLLPGVDLRLVFLQQTDDVRLIAAKNEEGHSYEIELKEMILYVKKVTLAPSLFVEHEKRLQQRSAIYVMRGFVTREKM